MRMHTPGSAAGAPSQPTGTPHTLLPASWSSRSFSHLAPHPLPLSTPHFIMKPQLFQVHSSVHCLKFIRLQTGLVGLYTNASMALGIRRVFSSGGVKWHWLGRNWCSLSDGSLCSDFEGWSYSYTGEHSLICAFHGKVCLSKQNTVGRKMCERSQCYYIISLLLKP